MTVVDQSQLICMALHTRHEPVLLHTLKAIDVGLRNSIEYGVAVVQSCADDGARRILVDEWTDVSQSSHVIIASANNTEDVLVEVQVAVKDYTEYSQLRNKWYRYSRHQDAAGLVEFGDLLSCARGDSFPLV